MFVAEQEYRWDEASIDADAAVLESVLESPDEVVSIPADLDEMSPGPVLAAFLSTIDLSSISGYDRVVVLRAYQRMASHFEAWVNEAMASIADFMMEMDQDLDVANEAAELELRAALRLTRRAATKRLELAQDLHRRLPAVGEALARGDIDVRRAWVLCNGTVHLDTDTARRLIDTVIDDAPRLTTGQLGAKLRKLCLEVDPDDARKRYQEALDERRVVKDATESGTANLMIFDVAPDRAALATAHIEALARSLRTEGEERSIDQLRADVAIDLLCGVVTGKKAGRGSVNIRVDLTTLAELDDKAGELSGFGPVIADIARQVAKRQQSSQWCWTLTDPESGMVLDTGITRRRPTAAQKRRIQAEDQTCTFPGCRMPANDCDIDHRRPFAKGGPTIVRNLDLACRHDHIHYVKHRWKRYRLPDGDYLWISPLGHRYTTSGRPAPSIDLSELEEIEETEETEEAEEAEEAEET
ncbi:MAG: DUF222 domain-containing protein [Acidimicrobiia bacterium]